LTIISVCSNVLSVPTTWGDQLKTSAFTGIDINLWELFEKALPQKNNEEN
jgi:hypothetical protein